MNVQEVIDDLVAEQAALDRVVAGLTEEQWRLATPSPRWSVADQIGHLTYFDATATLAITDAAAFAEHRTELIASLADDLAVDEATLGAFRQLYVSCRDQCLGVPGMRRRTYQGDTEQHCRGDKCCWNEIAAFHGHPIPPATLQNSVRARSLSRLSRVGATQSSSQSSSAEAT